MRASWRLGVTLAAVIAMAACGGGGGTTYGGGSTSAPTAPTPTPAAPSNTVTINIVDTNGGAKAFQPNPMTVSTGQSMVWKNNTNDEHHIVMDDGSGDSGITKPGASSAPIALKGSAGTYHCTNHPTMVGSINGATAPAPSPGDPGYGY